MTKFIIASNKEINTANVQSWVSDFQNNYLGKLEKLEEFYKGIDDLQKVQFGKCSGATYAIDNKVHVNLAHMITNNSVNYFIGKPVSYKFNDDFKEKEQINQLKRDNKEDIENKILAKDCSKYGVAYELINIKEEGNNKLLYYKRLNPLTTFVVVDDTILQNKICAITYTTVKDKNATYQKGFVYDSNKIQEFTLKSNTISFINEENNVFGILPVVVYQNNDEMIGDYEPVTELLTAYSKLYSCSFDDFESIANALLIFYNTSLSDEDRKKLKSSRALGIQSEDGQKDVKAEYIYKKLDTSSFQALRDLLRDDIFAITNVADFTDENFGGNQSGVAISYKLLGFENLRTDKVTFFAQGLIERWEIIGKSPTNEYELNPDSIILSFYANIPENIAQDLEYVTLWEKGAISKRTMLSKMESVPDVDAELDELEKEEKESIKKTKEVIHNEEMPKPKQKLRV